MAAANVVEAADDGEVVDDDSVGSVVVMWRTGGSGGRKSANIRTIEATGSGWKCGKRKFLLGHPRKKAD